MIDPTKPVFLKRNIVDPKTGNTYIPLKGRPLQPGEIPAHLLNDTNAYQVADAVAVEESQPDPDPTRKLHPSAEYLDSTAETKTLDPLRVATNRKGTTKNRTEDTSEE